MREVRYHELRMLIVSFVISWTFAVNPISNRRESAVAINRHEFNGATRTRVRSAKIHHLAEQYPGGFSVMAKTFSVEPGLALGMAAFDRREARDLALLSLSNGHMLGQSSEQRAISVFCMSRAQVTHVRLSDEVVTRCL